MRTPGKSCGGDPEPLRCKKAQSTGVTATDSKGVPTVRHFRRSYRDDDRGAAAVEFALLLPLFLVLCFGTISGGIVFNDKLSLSQGVREGARYGATLVGTPTDTTTATTFLSTVRTSARDSAFGQLGTEDATFCVGFIPATTSATSWYMTDAATTAVEGTCPDSPTTRGIVVVIGQKPGEFNLILDVLTTTLTSVGAARYEGTS